MDNVLIIGGGVAGLSAGIFCQMKGYNTVICEKHSTLGGNLTGWNRGGYHIDNCIHWLTGTNRNTDTYRLWLELGALGNVGVYQPETLYTYESEKGSLSLYSDVKKLADEMLKTSPYDKREIEYFISAIEALRGMDGIAGENCDLKFTASQKLKNYPKLARYYGLSVKSLAKKFKNEVIRGFLTSFLTEDFSALALLWVFATFVGGNGGIPEGGSKAMAQRMTARYYNLGGTAVTGKRVVRINIEGERAVSAELSDGSTIRADAFIITADPKTVFKKMLDVKMPSKLKRLYESPYHKRFSSFQCAFSCAAEKLPFKGDLIFDVPERYKNMLSAKHVVLREFSHEKSFAPEGCNVIQSMIFCDEKTAESFIEARKNPVAYAARKQFLSNVILRLIEEKFPCLIGKIDIIDVWTPATYNRYTLSEMGSYMGFAFGGKALPRRVPCEIDGLENVFLATQWQQAPGGLPIAASCGKLAAKTLEKKNLVMRSMMRARGNRPNVGAGNKDVGFSA